MHTLIHKTTNKVSLILILILSLSFVFLPSTGISANSSTSQQAKDRVSNAIALYVGRPHAFVHNVKKSIDSQNPLVSPLIKDSRTLVPIRFVAENLGASVDWNNKSKTVTISLDGKTVKLVLNSRIMEVDSEQVIIDVPATIVNSRTFLPLRAVSEAFGKKVLYERKLILISDHPQIIHPHEEVQLIDEIISWFDYTTAPAVNTGRDLSLKEIAAFDESVVVVLAYDENRKLVAQGSGFSIGKGLFVTNAHVLAPGWWFEIITNDEVTHDIEGIVQYDTSSDLAIIKTKEFIDVKPLKLGSIDSLVKGEEIVTIGSPEGLQNTISTGIVSGFRETINNVEVIQISAPITHGSSGGPLFNMQGYVVGVTTFGSDTGNLNFAVAIDYINTWIDLYRSRSFDEITVNIRGRPSRPIDPASTLLTEDVINVGSTAIPLRFDMTDVVMHPTKPLLYLTDKGNQKVYQINYLTGKTAEIFFDLPPESITFAHNEVYVALLKGNHSSYWQEESQKGAVAIIDADTFTLKEQFDIDIDPFDILADDDGYIYIVSGSGQWTNIKSYSRDTLKARSVMTGIRHRSYAGLHPNLNRIYLVNSDISPRDMEMITFSDGKFVNRVDSPYHGDYPLDTNFKISSDGNFIFNGSGTIFFPNLTYYSSLDEPFSDIAFNLNRNEFYTSPHKSLIYVYDYDTFEKKVIYKTQASAKKLFYQNNRIIAIGNGGGKFGGKPIIEVFDLER